MHKTALNLAAIYLVALSGCALADTLADSGDGDAAEVGSTSSVGGMGSGSEYVGMAGEGTDQDAGASVLPHEPNK